MFQKEIAFIFITLLTLSFASAYGVSSPYWKGNPLRIAPGDTKEVSITLQNMDAKDIKINAEITRGSDIASIQKNEYIVPAGTKNTEILVTVKIPEDVKLNEEYEITISSKEINSGTTGGVALGVAFETTFEVIVSDVEKVNKENPLFLWLIGALIIIALFSVYFIKIKKRK